MKMEVNRLVFVVNNAAFFVSHRLPLAQAAVLRGWDVTLITGQPGSPILEAGVEEPLKRANIRHIRTAFRSMGMNPLVECAGFVQLWWAMWRIQPSVVHTASPKAGLYGGLTARMLGVPCLVVAVSGMGFLFTGEAVRAKAILKWVYEKLMQWVFRHPNKVVVVQNPEDHAALLATGLVRADDALLIPGSGVSLEKFRTISQDTAESLVILPARMLRDKGIEEFVHAARLLRNGGCTWRFALVGTADYANPSAVPYEQIRLWMAEGMVEWWGHREDMPAVYARAGIVCLPSHREGMPKCLLEAAAAGRPVVTTDVAGCRDAIIPKETGDLVPVRDPQALANVLEALIGDPGRRTRYGLAGRDLAVKRYSIESVVNKTMTVYERLLANASR